ncbi:methyltransferase [Spirosoma montaniterrae]|uniref:Methyltransferase n=1 Tax=Spirosoma montaniterrae TaxID=1178516 RepID=A0A1P9X4N6_9BACT|nr:methyltransferase [Spirosoma montaniterrae]
METVLACPLCNTTRFSPFLVCRDYLVSQQDFAIQQCDNCGLRLTNPRPDLSEIGNYYKSYAYVSHNDQGGGLINSIYRTVRSYTLKSKLSLLNKLNAGVGSLLDVGCGTGAFLETCQNGGWKIAGMEPDADAREVAEKKLNLSIAPSLDSISSELKQFDSITLWHVLEHIPNLGETLEQLRQLLTEQGTLIIAVPNSDSYDATHYGRYWAAYDVPRHLYHFTPATMKQLVEKHGMRIQKQIPMNFDAFYIALLSTKYRKGNTDYINSGWTGLVSNLKASTSGHSSSITYIIKKM